MLVSAIFNRIPTAPLLPGILTCQNEKVYREFNVTEEDRRMRVVSENVTEKASRSACEKVSNVIDFTRVILKNIAMNSLNSPTLKTCTTYPSHPSLPMPMTLLEHLSLVINISLQ